MPINTVSLAFHAWAWDHPLMYFLGRAILISGIQWIITITIMSIVFHFVWKTIKPTLSFKEKIKLSSVASKWFFFLSLPMNFLWIWGLLSLIIQFATFIITRTYLSKKFINNYKLPQESAKKLADKIVGVTILGFFILWIILIAIWL